MLAILSTRCKPESIFLLSKEICLYLVQMFDVEGRRVCEALFSPEVSIDILVIF